MSATLEKVTEEIRGLSLQDRQELLVRLIRDLDSPADISSEEMGAAWDKEISQRIEQIDSGKVKMIPAEEVFARMQARLDQAG